MSEPSEAAMFWLNDHCGRRVMLYLHLDVGDGSTAAVEHEGMLLHWREYRGIKPQANVEFLRESLRGHYFVGDLSVNVTSLPEATIVRDEIALDDIQRAIAGVPDGESPDCLQLEVAAGVQLEFIAHGGSSA